MKSIQILLADAAFLVREGIKSVVAGYPWIEVIGEATHSQDLIDKVNALKPDVVIMDYNAPGAFSISDVHQVTQLSPLSHILIISSNLQKSDVLKVLEYGAKGFLLKECDQTEILGAINAIAKDDKFFCGKVLDIILERRATPVPISVSDCEPTSLTTRETEVVKLMAAGIPAQQIADQLCLSVHTIYTHRKNIMRKLGVTTAAEVIVYAINTSLMK